MESDGSIARDEWCRLISEAYGELYTIVFESGMEYFEYAEQMTSNGTNVLAEIADHLSTVTLAYLADATTGRYRALRELMAQERTMMSGLAGSNRATSFALVDDKIYLYPTPPAGQIYEMRYVPQPPELVETVGGLAVNVDVVTPDGLAFLVWNVAVMAQAKSETDATLATQRLEEARVRFTESVGLRALNAPRRRILDFETDGGNGMEWATNAGWGDW